MLILFILLTLVVGVIVGAAIGYETRDLREQPTGWRPWLLFVIVAGLVAGCAWLVERINETEPLSGPTKTLVLLGGAVAFAISLFFARRPR